MHFAAHPLTGAPYWVALTDWQVAGLDDTPAAEDTPASFADAAGTSTDGWW